MYECYECGNSFHFYGDCPSCGSVNVSPDADNDIDDIDDYEDDVFEDEDEISEALHKSNYDDE